MKRLFYLFIAALVRSTIWFSFSRVEVQGMDRVSWDQPCILSPNHQNAFLDALLVGTFVPVKLTFLSRASVFGTVFDWFLDALGMTPVYRRRDGFSKVAQNKQIFAEQRDRLAEGGALVMFSEKEHGHTYYLRPLTRGSARLALETQEDLDREVQLVPVGINYYHLTHLGFKVSIIAGEPISVDEYMDAYREHDGACINALRDDLTERMKGCMLVPDKTDNYWERLDRINRKTEHLSFSAMKRALEEPEGLEAKGDLRPWLQWVARWISRPLNVGPLWFFHTLKRWVDDPPFELSLKFAIGMLVFPPWWLLLFAVVAWLTTATVGGIVVTIAVATILLRIVLIRLSNPPHVHE